MSEEPIPRSLFANRRMLEHVAARRTCSVPAFSGPGRHDVEYVRADIADRHKRERDRFESTLKAIAYHAKPEEMRRVAQNALADNEAKESEE